MPRDNCGARIMREKGWHDGEGLGAQSSGRTENIPIDPPWNRNKRSRGDEPVRFIPASTNSGCHSGTGSAYSPSLSDQQPPWVPDSASQRVAPSWLGSETCDERLQERELLWQGSEARDSMPSSGTGWGNDSGPSSEATGAGPQPTCWAICPWNPEDHVQGPQEHAWTGQDGGWTGHDHTWRSQHDDDMRGLGEEDGQEDLADQQKPKKKRKKSANPGAHKRWLEAEMQPDDYTSDFPKWSFWSGKLGWSGFAKSSWDWLDGLYQEATDRKEPRTA